MFSPLAGAPTPVTERTPQVLDAIVGEVAEINHIHHDRDLRYMVNGQFVDKKYNTGFYVSEAHLAALTSLDVSGGSDLLPSAGSDVHTEGNWFSLLGDATEVRPGDFDGMRNLTSLRLDNNELRALPGGLFDNLTHLTYLDLSGNALTTLPAGIFDKLTHLTTLSLSGNALTTLPAGLFDKLTNLTTLNLSGNALTTLPAGLFDKLTNLTYLNLLANPLHSLPNNYFDNLTHLTTLLLPPIITPPTLPTVTAITPVANRTPQVRDAIVAAAGVNSAAAVTAAHLAAITELDLSESGITELKSGDFNDLFHLASLAIGGEFSALSDGIFDHLVRLKALGIVSTQLGSLPPGIFDPLLNLQFLVIGGIDGNELRSWPSDQTELNSLTAEQAPLRSLTAEQAPLNLLPPGIFDNLVHLKRLQIANTRLSSLPAGIFDNFTNIPMIFLSNNQLRSLPDSIFDKATMVLDLSGNQLSSLPDGIFAGIFDTPPDLTGFSLFGTPLGPIPADRLADLGEYTTLNLTGNLGAPLPLTISLERVGTGQFKAVVPTGAPFELVLPIQVANGTINEGATSLTIPVGSVESDIFTVTPTGGRMFAVSVDIETLPALWKNHSGYTLVKSADLPLVFTEFGGILGISERTPEVRDAIVDAVPGVNAAADVTEAHLAAITELFPDTLNSVKVGDFEGLTGLTDFGLTSRLTSIPAGLFDDLSNVEAIQWLDVNLTTLPAGVFDSLTNLTELQMEARALSSLPAGVFDNLTHLTDLVFSAGQLTSLPDGLFDNLTHLTDLLFSAGQLTSLPDGLFSGLTSLTTLNLFGDTLTLTVSLEIVGTDQFKAVAPTGAPFDIVLPVSITNGSISSGETTVTIPQGSVESGTRTVTRTISTNDAVTIDIGTVPSLPPGHNGYALVRSTSLPLVFPELGGIVTLRDRTPQVRDAIVRAAGVQSAADVTAAHLSGIVQLDLESKSITSLKVGDFNGLTSLYGIFLRDNQLTTLPAGIFDEMTGLTTLNLEGNQLSKLPAGIFANLTGLSYLTLADNQLTTLPAGIFEGPSRLLDVWLDGNQFTTLPVGIFKSSSLLPGVSSLRKLYLEDNPVDPLPLTVSLEKVTEGQFKAVAPTGAPFDIVLPINSTNGSISGGETTVTIPKGDVESGTRTVTRTPSTTAAVTVDIGTLPSLPQNPHYDHHGYALHKSADLPLKVISASANAPVFTDGTNTTRAIAENTAAGQNIGTAVAATDADNDTLTYTLGGTDAASFSIVSTSGQLQTSAALDYETKSSYSVTVSVSDGNDGSDAIDVTINITDANDAPVFTDGTSTIRAIAENTAAGTNIGTPVAATDADTGDTLIYSIGGTDAASFSIVSASGQLRTKAALDYETKSSYTVTVTVYDGNGGGDRTTVTINVTDVNDNPINPPLSERTPQVRDAIVAAVPGVNTAADVTAEHLAAITALNLRNKGITSLKSGDFEGLTALTWLFLRRNNLTDLPSGIFDRLTTLTDLNLEINNLTDLPSGIFDELTALTTLRLNNNGLTDLPSGIFDELTALTTLRLNNNEINNISTLEDLTALTELNLADNSISHISVLSNLTALTRLDLNDNSISDISPLENLNSLETLYIWDNSITDIPILDGLTSLTNLDIHNNSINDISALGNLNSLERLRLEYNSISDISALENLTSLIYLTLHNNSISDVSALENLTALTLLYLSGNPISDYGPLRRLIAAIAAIEDHPGLTLDITIPPVSNNIPSFTDGTSTTRSVAENTASGQNIGSAVAATDSDTGDTLTYTLGGTDAASFSIVSTSGQLQTSAPLNYETKTSYSVTVSVSDGNDGSDSIDVTINITNVNEGPVFSEGSSTTRSIAENTAAGQNIGAAVAASDPDSGTTLTYTLGGTDAASFSIVSTTGQLQTRAALDYDTKTTYSVAITVSDGSLTDSITVTINVTDVNEVPPTPNTAPVFGQRVSIGNISATVGTQITAIILPTATDVDGDTITYALTPTLPAGLAFNASTRLLSGTPTAAVSATVYTYTASDGKGGSAALAFIIEVNAAPTPPVNNAPVFSDGDSTTRAIAENTAANTNIGTAVAATDSDTGDTLTYTLGGTDAASFSIVSTSGQLQTKAALDYETKSSYTVTVSVSDGNDGSDSITVTINLTNVNEAPEFTDGTSTTRAIAENTASGQNIGTAVAATDVDSGTTLTYTLGGTDASSFSVSTSGQLQTSAALDYETKSSYSVTVSVSDGSLTDSITVTINVTNANDAPVFSDGDSTTRAIAENTAARTNIGTAIAATDQDTSDTLTYTLGGTDASSFSIVSTSGQLQTSAALDYETKSSYSVTVSVSDGSLTDGITVTINVTNVNEAPVFSEGSSTTRSIAENTAAGQNIGAAVAATDVDSGTTLTYTLGGTDAASFSIVSTSGQLQTRAALDYDTKTTYSVAITVSDGSLTDSITVTINVTDVSDTNNAPTFTDGDSTTRAVAENTTSGQNIGAAVAATDADTGDTLTYTLDGTDAASFSIVSTSGQLQTSAALDYETKNSYSVTVSVSDGNEGSDSIDVTISITNANDAPVFSDGDSTTRAIPENTAANTNIGTAIAATDQDTTDTLTYTLGGTDAAFFSIVSTSGQLQTKAALDYETKSSYSVTVSVSDSNSGSDSITVTINLTNVNEAPEFTEGTSTTRSVAEDASIFADIGSAVSATDPDSGTTLTYTLGGTDGTSFGIDSPTGQLYHNNAAKLDYETKTSYSVTITVSDGSLTDSITVTINVTNANDAPVFSDGDSTTRAIAENTAANTNIGAAVAATDQDTSDTLTYTLGGTDASSFSIVSTSGQLQTKAALDYETKTSYSVTVSVSDGNSGSDSIDVTINVTGVNETPPAFTEGTSATRTIAENTAANTNIGTAVAATDSDTGDTLTYTLGGTDAASFSIVSTSGQLKTKAALDYETKTSYAVTVSVSDGNGGSDSITVTINVTDANDAPVFSDGTSTTRSVAENTTSGENIGTAVAATDADTGDTLTYTLGGTDAASFSIVSTSGQLQTSAALDYDIKSSYSVTVSVSDGNSGTDSITVTINVTDVDDTPIDPPLSERTQQVRDAIVAAVSGVTDADDVTAAHLAAITELDLELKSITSLKSGDFDGLTALTTLNLGRNAMTSLPSGIFDELTALTDLKLGGNNLTSLPDNIFDKLTSLTSLDMETVSGENGLTFSSDIFDELTNLTTLNLAQNKLTSLPSDIFDELTNLTTLGLYNQKTNTSSLTSLPSDIFDELTSLTSLGLHNSGLTSLPSGIFDELTSLTSLILNSNRLTSLPSGIFDELTSLTSLGLSNNGLTSLPSGIFEELPLFNLFLNNNELTTLSDNIFKGNRFGLNSLLRLQGNTVDPLPITISLEKIAEGQFKATAHTGATFNYVLPLSVTNGSINGGATSISINTGNTDSNTLTVTRTAGTTAAVTVNIGTLPIPSETRDSRGHTGYALVKSEDLPLEVIVAVGNAPTSVKNNTPQLPEETALLPNFPNPFNPETWVPYQLSKSADVTLTIYNMRGVVVRELKLGHQSAGVYTRRSRAIHWDGRNMFGEKVAAGVYFYTLTAGDFTATRKMLIAK